VNQAGFRCFIRSRQPYYGWWFYFLVKNAASGELNTISPALVPKNTLELLSAYKHWHTLHILHFLHVFNIFYWQDEVGWENLESGSIILHWHAPDAQSRLDGCNGLAR
jgi:hypothetical protein